MDPTDGVAQRFGKWLMMSALVIFFLALAIHPIFVIADVVLFCIGMYIHKYW